MAFWLFKSEPASWSWQNQLARGAMGEEWSGIRNYQARNNMRMMQLGDQGFFYHSNQGKEIVGVVAVCALSAPDSTTDDPRWDCIQLKAIAPLKRPVSLKSCKAHPNLQNMALVALSRLSVQPVTKSEWDIIIAMSLT